MKSRCLRHRRPRPHQLQPFTLATRPSFFQSALCAHLSVPALAVFVLLVGPLNFAGSSGTEEHRATDHSNHPTRAKRSSSATASELRRPEVAAFGVEHRRDTAMRRGGRPLPLHSQRHRTRRGNGADLRSRCSDAACVAVFADGGITNARCQTGARAMLHRA